MMYRIALTLLVAAVSAGASTTAAPKSALPFIEGDYAKALAEARTRGGIPIFVESWAPW